MTNFVADTGPLQDIENLRKQFIQIIEEYQGFLKFTGITKSLQDSYDRLEKIKERLLYHIIDCSVPPKNPIGLTPSEDQIASRFTGIIKINRDIEEGKRQVKNIITFYRHINNDIISGYEFRKFLEGQPVLTANLLDFLEAHQEYVPDEMKTVNFVHFWTIYQNQFGRKYIRYSCWSGTELVSNDENLDDAYISIERNAIYNDSIK